MALREKELINATTDKNVDSNINEKTLFIKDLALGQNALGVIQQYDIDTKAYNKFRNIYRKTVIKKIAILNNFLNIWFKKNI